MCCVLATSLMFDARSSQDSEVNLRRQVAERMEDFKPLRFLEDIQTLIEGYTSTSQVGLVPAPIMLYASSTIFETSCKYALQQDNSNIAASKEFATAVLHNTSSALLVQLVHLEYQAFVDEFTGDSLRLEMLGLIYIASTDCLGAGYRTTKSFTSSPRLASHVSI